MLSISSEILKECGEEALASEEELYASDFEDGHVSGPADAEDKEYASESFEQKDGEVDEVDYGSDSFQPEQSGAFGYGDESFEPEESSKAEEQHLSCSADNEPVTIEHDEDVGLTPSPPQLGRWCTEKLAMLKNTASKPRTPQAQKLTCAATPNIPGAAVARLIEQASRAPMQRHRSQSRRRQNVKVPVSMVERAQTQLWLSNRFIDSVKTENVAAKSSLPIFCSDKQETLCRRLATMRVAKDVEKWAAPGPSSLSRGTLEFIRGMAAEQRKINAVMVAPEENGEPMLHRIAASAQLQLQESIDVRHQAAALLELDIDCCSG